MSRFNFSLLPTSPLTNGKIRTGDLFNCRRWTIGLIQQSYKFGSFPSLHKANHIVHLRLLGKELHDLNQRPNEQGNWTNHNATTLPWNMFWPLPRSLTLVFHLGTNECIYHFQYARSYLKYVMHYLKYLVIYVRVSQHSAMYFYHYCK